MTRIQIREDKEVLLRNRLKLTLAKFVKLWHTSYKKKILFDIVELILGLIQFSKQMT